MTVENVVAYGDIQVFAHVSNIGWQGWTAGSGGTVGQGNAMEAVKIKLTGDIAGLYDVYYRAHIADAGWLGWAKNGESAGSEGMAKDMQVLQIVLVEKGGAAPGATEGAFLQPMVSYRSDVSDIGWQAWVHALLRERPVRRRAWRQFGSSSIFQAMSWEFATGCTLRRSGSRIGSFQVPLPALLDVLCSSRLCRLS